MGSNLSIAAGETRGKRMSVTIPTTPKGVEPISGFKIVPAYGIFSPNCQWKNWAKARKSLA
ncbi:hypothetical protein [Algoriphagus boritolerans]|uniref:hypothetical protein n=1 Tax=Algoriphagus boritolerans TaxID=308111 RepID=UPI000CDECC70|nr:hypothetical protein [Algoriphagus boritolerans]